MRRRARDVWFAGRDGAGAYAVLRAIVLRKTRRAFLEPSRQVQLVT